MAALLCYAMPHAFKPRADHPAVPFLVRLHADLGGKILENRKEAKRLAEAMQHVEAVIRLFDPAVGRIAARRRYKGNGIFSLGELRLDVAPGLPRSAIFW